jgi:hypothetical protein
MSLMMQLTVQFMRENVRDSLCRPFVDESGTCASYQREGRPGSRGKEDPFADLGSGPVILEFGMVFPEIIQIGPT